VRSSTVVQGKPGFDESVDTGLMQYMYT